MISQFHFYVESKWTEKRLLEQTTDGWLPEEKEGGRGEMGERKQKEEISSLWNECHGEVVYLMVTVVMNIALYIWNLLKE